jgi:hypothetical protein
VSSFVWWNFDIHPEDIVVLRKIFSTYASVATATWEQRDTRTSTVSQNSLTADINLDVFVDVIDL